MIACKISTVRRTDDRLLVHVPILHTKEDMGSLGSRLMASDAYCFQAHDYWQKIEVSIKNLAYDFRKVKVYQDGLPDTKPLLIEKIVNEVQSANYELLRWLKKQGATLVGSENPNLIKEEYDFLKSILEAKNEEEKTKARTCYQKKAESLLSLRDHYIVQKIDKTLKKGEVGILFLGAAHKIETFLPDDIKSINL